MSYSLLVIFCLGIFTMMTHTAHANNDCTLIVSFPSGKVLMEEGDCEQRRSPFSTFKLPLAVMAADAGIIKDTQTPSWDYKDVKRPLSDHEKKIVNPTTWLNDSIVWYSQKITTLLGIKKFQTYVDQFDYGNRDLSGNPGKYDGLTEAWLLSSLQISPKEQITFLQKLLEHKLGVSGKAYDLTNSITPKFSAGSWTVYGKTGTGWLRTKNGEIDRNRPQGWFVGWAKKQDETILFAKLRILDKPTKGYAGLETREIFLNELPVVLR